MFAMLCLLATPLAVGAAQPGAVGTAPADKAAAASTAGSTTALAAASTAGPAGPASADACPPLLDRSFARLQDETQLDLCRFAGKVLLVVNTASYCGFTKQYQGLEALYARYADRGLVVLGFPSNDFKQEASSNREIAELCFDTYGVKFPMFVPSQVTGTGANPLYADLARITGQQPAWNFHKYLVARDGRTVTGFPSKVGPLDRKLLAEIEASLDAR